VSAPRELPQAGPAAPPAPPATADGQGPPRADGAELVPRPGPAARREPPELGSGLYLAPLWDRDAALAVLGHVRDGLLEPWAGLGWLVRDRQLLALGLRPALVVGALVAGGLALGWVDPGEQLAGCGLSPGGSPRSAFEWIAAFALAMSAFAAVPPFVFHNTYARLAALGHARMGFGPRTAFHRGLATRVWEMTLQGLIIATAFAAISVPLSLLPGGVGVPVSLALGSLWALHWVVVEALDNARTLPEGADPRSIADDERDRAAGPPWFGRLLAVDPQRRLGPLFAPVRMCGRLSTRWSRRWHEELRLVERHPWTAAGFGLATAGLLAVPLVNVLFRPAIVLAATRLRARLEGADPDARGDGDHGGLAATAAGSEPAALPPAGHATVGAPGDPRRTP